GAMEDEAGAGGAGMDHAVLRAARAGLADVPRCAVFAGAGGEMRGRVSGRAAAFVGSPSARRRRCWPPPSCSQLGSEAAPEGVLATGAGLDELEEIVGAAGL